MRRFVAALTCVIAACWTIGPPRPPRREPALAYTATRLDNGLRVVIVPDAQAAEVQVLVRYAVGYADDPPGREGTAHLSEHLSFQRVRDGRPLHAALARMASFNAYTDSAATTFVARALPDRLGELLAIEQARVTAPCVDDATVARERAVVRGELYQRGQSLRVMTLLHAAFYADHRYRRFGDSEGTLGAITAADACAFAGAGYMPDAAVVVISGAVTTADAERAVRATLGTLPRGAHPAAAIAPAPEHRRSALSAPIDVPVVAFGWPLPGDIAQRARVRALATILVDHLTDELHGEVAQLELGGDGAPIIAVAIVPAPGETAAGVTAIAQRTIAGLPRSLDNTTYYDETFDHVQHLAIARFVAGLEDGGAAELRIAEHALAGRDPRAAVAGELRALETFQRDGAIALARTALAPDRASLVTIEPEHARRRGQPLQLALARHDDPPVDDEDPADAERPAPRIPIRSPLATSVARTLPSGARVLLLPASSMPSVDVRFVYEAGSGDEPIDRPGVATVAAVALRPHAVDMPEVLRFYEGGGLIEPSVAFDSTTFRARALERDLDVTLSALARWLDAGHYGALKQVVGELGSGRHDPNDAAADAAWRSQLFGWDHPYARAVDYARLDQRDAQRFRAAHYSAKGLTIIVAGGFDPELAYRWIAQTASSLQAGTTPPPRTVEEAKLAPGTFCLADDTALVQVHIALPAIGERANQLLVAAMLDEAVGDVRFQLSASYGVYARLAETRLASWYEIAGSIDATRITEALALIRDRVAALRPPHRATAARFLRARRSVATALALVPASARALADRAESIVAAGRTIPEELATADTVRALTLEALAPQLARLDLAQAAVQLRGPTAATAAACRR